MHEQQGGHHAAHPKWKQVPSIGQSHTGSRHGDRGRDEDPRAVEVHRRSGHSIGVIGSRESRRRARTFRKRQAPSLQDCLCFREGSGCSLEDPLPLSLLTSRKRNHRPATLRPSPRNDLAPPPPVTRKGRQDRRALARHRSVPRSPNAELERGGPSPADLWRSPGRAGFDIVPTMSNRRHPRSAQCLTGQPPRYTLPVHLSTPRGRPPACHRRGRSPIPSPSARPRRWGDAGPPAAIAAADQKAGATGRHATRIISRLPARPTVSRTRDTSRSETDGQAGRPPPQYEPEGRRPGTPAPHFARVLRSTDRPCGAGVPPAFQSPPTREPPTAQSDTPPATLRPLSIAMALRLCVFAPLR